jgi:hypothetical protein
MKLIPLTQGQFAKVDDDDFDWLNQWNWCAHLSSTTHSFEAVRNAPRDPITHKSYLIRMHREIMNAKAWQLVDHRFHDTLDNRKSELRICTHKQNMHNMIRPVRNTSGFKGVSWHRGRQRWRARIKMHNREFHIGAFVCAIDAAIAYDRAAIKRFGEFAMTNKALGLLP